MTEQVLHLAAVPNPATFSPLAKPNLDEDVFGQGALANLRTATDFSACLLPLIQALGWKGDPRHIAEALPHFIDSLDITSFLNVMGNLNYKSRWTRVRLDRIDRRLLPCLFVADERATVVALESEPGSVKLFDSVTGEVIQIEPPEWSGVAYFFTPVEEAIPVKRRERGWFWSIFTRFRGLVFELFGVTFALNLLALATPLFVMSVYDTVIPTASVTVLASFAIGVLIAMISDLTLRYMRSRVLAFVGARLDNILGSSVFQRILMLPPSLTEGSTIGSQVARLRSFESVREAFTGPIALVLLELPFVILFIIVIAILGGPIAAVPIVMLGLFAVVALIFGPLVRSTVAEAARASSRRQEFVVETLSNVRSIKCGGTESVWLERFRDLAARAAMAGFRSSQISSWMSTISHVLMVGSGVATIAFGVMRVLEGAMTLGALVASMILVWRVLAPLQSAFLVIARISQVRSSIDQINSVMSMRPERTPHEMPAPLRGIKGRVLFSRVSLRYTPESDPALVGVHFDVNPGEVVAIIGPNSAGKSTLLKLLLGMLNAQAGSIQIDNRDIRQINPIDLRNSIGYVPQVPQFFYGTIAQNLRLANPLATDQDIHAAAAKAGVLDEILALEQGSGKWHRTGFEVRIGDAAAKQLPASFQQGLNLARAYLKQAPIMLFDEPGASLDFAGDQKFIEAVKEMKGKTTILIVTHRPSHIRLADKIVWLDSGHLLAAGPAEDVRKRIPGGVL
jgi:ATP-binding cassette subfamily C protein/ATP-binding cassette subfamily C protein LapB